MPTSVLAVRFNKQQEKQILSESGFRKVLALSLSITPRFFRPRIIEKSMLFIPYLTQEKACKIQQKV